MRSRIAASFSSDAGGLRWMRERKHQSAKAVQAALGRGQNPIRAYILAAMAVSTAVVASSTAKSSGNP
jgi:hypothetical protein